ncbi:MAG TPA: hypothetical protein VIF62_10780, partial [Labilithrix sp.]
GKLEEPRPRGRVAELIAQIAPDAASFADDRDELAGPAAHALEAPVEDPRAMQAIAAGRAAAVAKTPTKSRAKRTLALWGVLVVMFVAMWQFLTPTTASSPKHHVHADDATDVTWVVLYLPAVFLGTLAVAIAFSLVRQRRLTKRLVQAARAAALGDVATARAAYSTIANDRIPSVAGAAQLELAKLAARDADFATAIAACERGITRIAANATSRATTADILLPSLFGELAVAKASCGRAAEAETELAMLMKNHPMFALLASMHLRVRLVRAARAGDFAACAAIARERTNEMPMPRREELLGDLAIAAKSGASEDERWRLADEMGDLSVAKWIDAVAPGLRDAALASTRARIAHAEEAVVEDESLEDENAVKAARRV